MNYIYITSALFILLLGLISGAYPLIRMSKHNNSDKMPLSESFSAGIFLSLGIFHMLPDSLDDFKAVHVSMLYPTVLVLISCVVMFILHILPKYISKQHEDNTLIIVIVSLIILSIHSFIAGISLGISVERSQIFLMFFAIASHKWAASFTLGYQISRTSIQEKTKWILFSLFVISTPIGILSGDELKNIIHSDYALPTFHAIASGTFIFLGLDHLIDSVKYMHKNKNYKALIVILASFIFIYLTSLLE